MLDWRCRYFTPAASLHRQIPPALSAQHSTIPAAAKLSAQSGGTELNTGAGCASEQSGIAELLGSIGGVQPTGATPDLDSSTQAVIRALEWFDGSCLHKQDIWAGQTVDQAEHNSMIK